MNLEIQSRLSFYRRLEEVEHKKGISLVRHIETGQIYVEKVLTQYDKSIYDWLQQSKLPYVPQIYECMEEDGTLYLIEEYIQGITLETYIEQFGCLDLDAAGRVNIFAGHWKNCTDIYRRSYTGISNRQI